MELLRDGQKTTRSDKLIRHASCGFEVVLPRLYCRKILHFWAHTRLIDEIGQFEAQGSVSAAVGSSSIVTAGGGVDLSGVCCGMFGCFSVHVGVLLILLILPLTSVSSVYACACVQIVGTAFQAETASQRHQQAPLTANSDEVVTAIRSKSSNAPAACQKRAQAAAEAVLAECPGLPGYCPRPPHLKGLRSSDYLTPRTMHPHMAWQKQFVDRFVYGVGLKVRMWFSM